jgi:alkanesulfonate monooxygenase SsuD/methylene tetrahydromethanopterin reductase-like flavin-dependent oxidoreductase (luciferase family)
LPHAGASNAHGDEQEHEDRDHGRPGREAERTISGLIERAGEVELLGFDSPWMPAAFSFDAITALVAVGLQTSRLEIGTVPCQGSSAIRW